MTQKKPGQAGRKRVRKPKRAGGRWVEDYCRSGDQGGQVAEDWVRASVEYPRTLLRHAREAAADRGEPLKRLMARALDAEMRLRAMEAWTARARARRAPQE